MKVVEKQILVSASPETIFRIYADVERWCDWDPDTTSSYLNQGLRLGSKGKLTPAKGTPIRIEVSKLQVNSRFTVTSEMLLFRIDFDHELMPMQAGRTLVTHRVLFAGLLGALLRILLGSRIKRGLPFTLSMLREMAEKRERVNG